MTQAPTKTALGKDGRDETDNGGGFETFEKLLTPAEVGKRLSCSADTVLGWIHSRQLPALLISKLPNSRKPRYRIRPEVLEQFIAARSMGPRFVKQPRPPKRPPYRRIV